MARLEEQMLLIEAWLAEHEIDLSCMMDAWKNERVAVKTAWRTFFHSVCDGDAQLTACNLDIAAA